MRDHGDAGGGPVPGTAGRAESHPVNDARGTPAERTRDNAGMEIEQLEQIVAVVVTAGLVAGNFLMFTPWLNGEDPRQRQPVHSPRSKAPRRENTDKPSEHSIKSTISTHDQRVQSCRGTNIGLNS